MPERDYKVKARKKIQIRLAVSHVLYPSIQGNGNGVIHPVASNFESHGETGSSFFFFCVGRSVIFFWGSIEHHRPCTLLAVDCSARRTSSRMHDLALCGAVAHSPRHEDEGRHCSCSPVLKPDAVAHLPAGGRHSARWCHIWATLWTPPARSPWLPSA